MTAVRPKPSPNVRRKGLLAVLLALIPGAAMRAPAAPIAAVIPDLHNIRKWDESNGDTWDPFWADDGNLYSFSCDGRGFGSQPRNLAVHRLEGADLAGLTGRLVNAMDEYGREGQKEADGATWKVCGQEGIDGVFYAFVARNAYGKDSGDRFMRQTSFNSSLIKSSDRGKTWTRSAAENYARPMWPGGRFGAPCFIHYGRNGGAVARDGADRYVYALSNNGFWNNGDDFILGRIVRADLPKLNAADWTYFTGGEGSSPASWSPDLAKAAPVLALPGKGGWSAPAFVPEVNAYLLVSWYVTPTLKKWFEPGEVKYDFFQAEHPWGPWTFVSSLSDRFLVGGHMYGPNICARFQERRGADVMVSLFTSGCPFEDRPTGLYKMWHIPLILRTAPLPASHLVNDDDSAIRYTGAWAASPKRPYRDHRDDVHYTSTPGDAAELRFTGTGVEWLAEKHHDEGEAEVFLDGASRGTVNLKTENFPRLCQVPVFRALDLSPGPHTIRIVNRSPAFAILDAFRVYGGE